MWSKKAIFVLLAPLAAQQDLSARTWGPVGQAVIKGEFEIWSAQTFRSERRMESKPFDTLIFRRRIKLW